MWKWPHLKSWSPIWTKLGLLIWYGKLQYVHAVKSHIPRSKVIWRQVVKYAENVKMTSFEKFKSDLNQTWFIDMIWEPSYVHGIKGHIPRSKVIWGQVVNLHHPGDTNSPWTEKYFICFSINLLISNYLTHCELAWEIH